MVFASASKDSKSPTWRQIEYAVKRNFGGLENIDAFSIFREKLKMENLDEEVLFYLSNTNHEAEKLFAITKPFRIALDFASPILVGIKSGSPII